MILKVLIVEDEEYIRLGLVSTLDWIGMGCSVIGSAEDGVEGLRLIQDLKPDVVISDIRMPRMNGLDMLEEGSKHHSFKSILLTSYTEFEYAKRAIELRTYHYLLKPLDESILCGVIEKIRQDSIHENLLIKFECLSDGHFLMQLSQFNTLSGDEAPKDHYVQVCIRKILESSNQKISIENIAEELYVSASYLSRRYKSVMGQTFLDTLNMYRVRQAIILFGEGERHIADVADRTGFSNYKHFCNVFKRYTGMTPRDFIKTGFI